MLFESPFTIIPLVPFIISLVCSVVFFILPINKDIKKAQRYPLFYMLICEVFLYTIIIYNASLKVAYPIISKAALPYLLIVMAGLLIFHILSLVEIVRKLITTKPSEKLSLSDMDKNSSFIYADLLGKLNKNNEDDRSFLKRVSVIILPMACIGFMYLVFGVYELYFSNRNEFKFVFMDIFPISLLCFAAVLLLSFPIAFIFKGKNLDRLSVILGSISVLSYIQYAFLNKDTFITGEVIDTPLWIVHLNLWFWIAVPVVMCILCEKKIGRDTFIKGVIIASSALIVIQGAALPVLLSDGFSEKQNETHSGYSLDGSEQFEVSSKGNVIVFIMDTYHNGYFSDYLTKKPDSYSKYSDFIYYDDINSEVVSTTLSMPHLLTATPIDYSIPIMESNANAWKGENAELFYGSMQNDGYKVRLYTDSEIYCGGVENMLGKIDNVKEFEYSYIVQKAPTYFAFLSLSLFRYSPDFLKEAFYLSDIRYINQYTTSTSIHVQDTTSWKEITKSSKERGIVYYNDDYYSGLEKGLSTVDDTKLCIFQHIHGMHSPYISESGEGSESDALNGCMKIFDTYINELKEIGVYDNTTIILTADHGLHSIGESSPVMLIKPAGRKADRLIINSAPGNLQSDLLPTILDCSGLSYGPMEYSLLDMDENMKRERLFRIMRLDNAYPRTPKADSYGYSVANCYDEYVFTSSCSEFTGEGVEKTTHTITDYWW